MNQKNKNIGLVISLVLVVLVLFLTACGEVSATNDASTSSTLEALEGSSAPSEVEAQLLEKINTIRQSGQSCRDTFYVSSDVLVWNKALAGAAKTHVKDVLAMAIEGKIDIRNQAPPHEGSDGLKVASRATSQGYVFRTIAENLASSSDTNPNIEKVIVSWLASTKGHCEALVLSELEDIGLYVEDGVWAAVFGTPR